MRGLYALKPWYTRQLNAFTGPAVARGVSPDMFTALGVVSALGAGVAIGSGNWILALLLLAGRLAGGGLAAVGALVTFVITTSEPILKAHRRTEAALRPFAVAKDVDSDVVVARFPSAEPVAFAVHGDEPTTFLSSGLEDALRPAEVRAVLAHE